jgi:hypothetical protein
MVGLLSVNQRSPELELHGYATIPRIGQPGEAAREPYKQPSKDRTVVLVAMISAEPSAN